MNKYIFPGADASTPLGWFVDSLETAGFEVKSIDTIGVHYSATIWRWYRNWMSNKPAIIAKYGDRYDTSFNVKLRIDGSEFGSTSLRILQLLHAKALHHAIKSFFTRFVLSCAFLTVEPQRVPSH